MIERQTANILKISDLINSSYVKESAEFKPNYILVGSKKISRVNLIASVIDKADLPNYKSITLDDGTGNVSVRLFEDSNLFEEIQLGDIVLLIAKPREFNSEKYLIPEIIKKIKNPKWIDFRKKELNLVGAEASEDVVDKEEEVEEKEEDVLPAEKIIQIIRQLDNGGGADFEAVIQKSDLKDCEKIINSLLTQGDIFEVKPGKLKVLE